MKRKINNFILIFGILCIAYWLILGIGVRFGQSLMYLWPLAGVLCVLRWLFWRKDRQYRGIRRGIIVFLRAAFLLCLVFFLTVECIIGFSGRTTAPANADYIVVLGAKVNGTKPSGALYNRIASAAEYLEENPGTVAILSGGQGSDEGISEAECMRQGLVERGIDESRLILEEKSTDTSENLINSRAIIGDDSASVALVTNDFHLFRALHLAQGLGWTGVTGVSVPTTAISWPHYMMREFVGVMWDGLRGNFR